MSDTLPSLQFLLTERQEMTQLKLICFWIAITSILAMTISGLMFIWLPYHVDVSSKMLFTSCLFLATAIGTRVAAEIIYGETKDTKKP